MTAYLSRTGRRIALGTGLTLQRLGAWVGEHGWKLAIGRSTALLLVAAFAVQVCLRAPALTFAVPVVWLFSAWSVSDSSATPPPGSDTLSRDVHAGDTGRIARVERSPEGVMCILHPEREEVNDA